MFKRGKGRNSLGLIDAAQNGDLARVKAKLKAGCDVNSRDEVRAGASFRAARGHSASRRDGAAAGGGAHAPLEGCRLGSLPRQWLGRFAVLCSPRAPACLPSRHGTRRRPTHPYLVPSPAHSGSSPLSCGRRTKATGKLWKHSSPPAQTSPPQTRRVRHSGGRHGCSAGKSTAKAGWARRAQAVRDGSRGLGAPRVMGTRAVPSACAGAVLRLRMQCTAVRQRRASLTRHACCVAHSTGRARSPAPGGVPGPPGGGQGHDPEQCECDGHHGGACCAAGVSPTLVSQHN